MSWLLLNSVFSKIFSGLWDVCFGHYLATKNLNVAFCLLFLMLPNFRHAQKAKFHVTELSIFTFYFPVSCYILFLFPPPPPFFLFLGIYYASLWKEKFSWKPGELWNNFTIHNLLFERGKRWGGVEQDSYWNFLFNLACFFFGILSHLFNWIVLICVYMSMERWLIHKLGGKVVYDH